MSGGYCRYCDRRCFVDRVLPDGSWSGHMATCPAGMARDRAATGHDHTTAINPYAPRWRRHSNSGVNHLVRPAGRANSECGRAEASPWPELRTPEQPFVHYWDEPSDDPLMRCTSCVALEADLIDSTGGDSMTEDQIFAEWVILELMGHRRLAGFLTEQEIAGKGFLRLEIPGQPGATQLYNPTSVYCITPTTEAIARAVAVSSRPAPVQRWELPAATTPDDEAAEALAERFADDDGPF